jgi:hypothetical protein
MTHQSHSCTACGPAPSKTQLARRGLLRLAIAVSIITVLALGEAWVIERAPELNVSTDAAVSTDSHMMLIRQLEPDSPPVAVLH